MPDGDELRTLVRDVLWSLITGDATSIELFTTDVVAELTLSCATSRIELAEQLDDRRGVLSDVELEIAGLRCGASVIEVVWNVSGRHTGPLLVNDDELHEPSGELVRLGVVSQLELRDGRVSRMRHDVRRWRSTGSR
jgi:hypothetical protein